MNDQRPRDTFSPADILPHRPSGGDPTHQGVWLPLSFAVRLFQCYFGNGPRSGHTSSVSPAPPTELPVKDPNPMVVPPEISVTTFPSMYPQGVARK